MYKLSFLTHIRPIHEFVNAINGEAQMNVRNFFLEVKARNRYFSLHPQFFVADKHGTRYTRVFAKETNGFIGWLPYSGKRWDIATGKLPFKQYARANGLLTPEMHDPRQLPLKNVLLKKTASSFGNGLLGPFRQLDTMDGLALEEGDYFESFIEGRIAKIWFWNEQPAALELRDMPSVVGDGRSTVMQLVNALPNIFGREINVSALAQVLAYSGHTPESIPEEGQRVMVDYVYMSPLIAPQFKQSNALLDESLPQTCQDQLFNIGRVLNEAIPAPIRAHTMYTVDAILTQENQFMLLEANCNPQVHPDVYPWILKSLFLS